jgi:beta-lactamase regulating signal transducer with metallopeptidase domain
MFQLLTFYMGSLILRSIGIALVAGLFSLKLRNVAIRHAIGVALLASMLLMPAVDFLLPPSWIPARIQQIASNPPVVMRVVSAGNAKDTGRIAASTPAATATLSAAAKSVNWWDVAAALYALVALTMFIRLITGYRKLRKLRSTARAISDPAWEEIVASQRMRWRMPILLESDAVQVPMTIGFSRPAVILPADWKTWDDWKLQAVLFHEVAHVRRCDWAIAAISALSKCAYWLNPLAWILERKLLQLAEQSCDDAALNGIPGAAGYAEILLEFAAATQNGGRLMKGGVAMASHKIQERIERVLGMTQSGTGIVKIAGWTLVTLAAAPVIYSASALQVKSKTVEATVSRYAVEFGRNPASQAPAIVSQAGRLPAPAAEVKTQENVPKPAAELLDLFQAEPDSVSLQRELEDLKQKLAQAQLAAQLASQTNVGLSPERAVRVMGSMEFLQEEVTKIEEQLRKTQATLQQRAQSSSPPAVDSRDALLDLPDNEDDLLAYLKALARLRNGGNSFSVSFMGIQARTVSMKVAGQDYSFGCESCSFFVGEAVVSSATPPPSGPGVILRLSPDGSEMSVECRASICITSNEAENPGQVAQQEMVFGATNSFNASKLPSISVSKN